jgi:hypothetical protein
MIFLKIRKVCKPFRIVLGASLIITGFILDNLWFSLGIIPFMAGMVDFCPLCIITNKCDLPPSQTTIKH